MDCWVGRPRRIRGTLWWTRSRCVWITHRTSCSCFFLTTPRVKSVVTTASRDWELLLSMYCSWSKVPFGASHGSRDGKATPSFSSWSPLLPHRTSKATEFYVSKDQQNFDQLLHTHASSKNWTLLHNPLLAMHPSNRTAPASGNNPL